MGYESIGRIEQIAAHPIKGAARVELRKAKLTKKGIEGDRSYMIVRAVPEQDGISKFITQRDKRDGADKSQGLAVLSQIKPRMIDGGLLISWAGKDPIQMPSDYDTGEEMTVQIWDDIVQAIDQGDALAEWLSDHLNVGVRLVKASETFKRRADQDYMRNDNTVRFPDGYPVHWFLRESLDELSERAGEDIPWHTFRPNIVVSGSSAQAEHLVHSGMIGDIPFIDPKPCDRCPVTNVNQDTGEVKVGRALGALAQYKRWKKKNGKNALIFGENMLPLGEGEVRVGDEIVMTERRNPPLEYT